MDRPRRVCNLPRRGSRKKVIIPYQADVNMIAGQGYLYMSLNSNLSGDDHNLTQPSDADTIRTLQADLQRQKDKRT